MLKKLTLCGGALLLSCQTLLAQVENAGDSNPQVMIDTAWTTAFSAGLNFNQSAFSGNWKSGGVNSVAFSSIIAGRANYLKDRITWDNEMELLFGIVNNEGEG